METINHKEIFYADELELLEKGRECSIGDVKGRMKVCVYNLVSEGLH